MVIIESPPAGDVGMLSPPVPPSITTTTHKGSLTFDEEFRKEATPTDALQDLCFPEVAVVSKASPALDCAPAGLVEPVAVSCSSSACSASGNLSDTGSTHSMKSHSVVQRKVSRQGRASQRWSADPTSHSAIRLTTGCVPIVKGGKVLFVSASNKPAWIFPKGGWEMDETMEESAIRESFEEAGVTGVLGPKLTEVQYETRKARKRRLESEELQKRKQVKLESSEAKPIETSVGVSTHLEQGPAPNAIVSPTSLVAPVATETPKQATTNSPAHLSDEAFARIRAETLKSAKRCSDETASVQSDASGCYSQVRMTLFPLYVSCVKTEWPEGGRLRKAVEIDEAIAMLESRPELQTALKEVKEKGLHLNAPVR